MESSRPIMNPYAVILIAIISISMSAIFVRLADSAAPVIAFYRLFFSVILLFPFFIWKYRAEVKLISRRDWCFSVLAGVFLALHFILWFESLNYTSVASSVVLVTLQPLFAFIGTYIFFKEKLTLGAILSGILAIVGSFIISWGDFQISGMALLGDFLALVACVMVTAYLLFGQDIRKRLSLITYTFIIYGIGSITLIIYIVLFKYSFQPVSQTDWVWFILLAIFPTLLGHSLFNWALRWVSTNIISMSILLEPIGATILAYYILGESVLATQIAGGIIVLLGISLFLLSARKAKQLPFKKSKISFK
ncbi:DMT family transporter [Bacillus sp. HMF5848]|uniref:DMT family transporter n=1 Tax=Bacillus sp. HMF5848 TaxID=2495421 RepID=UPI000F7A8C3E|nr:DMT family transporter [Bacillus sp. HMF5848]RSK28294.1 DMT family transporter [Bacillus sp. HMF5848]